MSEIDAVRDVVVIGFGNELRGDDAAGPRVARTIEAQGWPRVRALDVAQLTPELAEDISTASTVVFVDASVRLAPGHVEVAGVRALPLSAPLGHLETPPGLLALAQAIFNHAPPAWLVTIGAAQLEVGDTLSPEVEAALPDVVQAIRALIERARQPGADSAHDHSQGGDEDEHGMIAPD